MYRDMGIYTLCNVAIEKGVIVSMGLPTTFGPAVCPLDVERQGFLHMC